MSGAREESRSFQILFVVGMVVVTLALVGYREPLSFFEPVAPPLDRPIQALTDGYVSSTTCRACHPSEYHSWHASYHRTMTQEPGPQAILPEFDGVVLAQGKWTYKLSQRGDEFWIETNDPNWRKKKDEATWVEKPVALVTGSHNFQVYWVPSGDTRSLAIFPMGYSILEERWVPIDSIFILPPNSQQRRDAGRWNMTCIRCHATRGQPKVAGKREMDTSVAEFGIACEACHGPAYEHIAANQNPARRYRLHEGDPPDETVVNPERLSARLGSMVCGQCHSVTVPRGKAGMDALMDHGYTYQPGEKLTDPHRQFVREGETQFWSDGMVRVSGREYNGLVTSPCYTHGDEEAGVLSCFSCHTLHRKEEDPRTIEEWRVDQLGMEMDSNAACTQCHPAFADSAALTAHSHHGADSAGSLCYNCHMPHTTWGAVKAIRSHEVNSPSVAATLATGRPNACNLCHLDRTLAWTAEHLEERFGIPAPELDEDERTIASSVRWTLIGDAGQRALMAWHFGWEPAREASGSAWMAPFLAHLIADPYDAVRNRAARSLRTLEGFQDFDFDSECPKSERELAQVQATERWARSAAKSIDVTDSSLLMTSDRSLLNREIERLLETRDNRRVTLVE